MFEIVRLLHKFRYAVKIQITYSQGTKMCIRDAVKLQKNPSKLKRINTHFKMI